MKPFVHIQYMDGMQFKEDKTSGLSSERQAEQILAMIHEVARIAAVDFRGFVVVNGTQTVATYTNHLSVDSEFPPIMRAAHPRYAIVPRGRR